MRRQPRPGCGRISCPGILIAAADARPGKKRHQKRLPARMRAVGFAASPRADVRQFQLQGQPGGFAPDARTRMPENVKARRIIPLSTSPGRPAFRRRRGKVMARIIPDRGQRLCGRGETEAGSYSPRRKCRERQDEGKRDLRLGPGRALGGDAVMRRRRRAF